ncbi:MAG: ROK family protein, partial [Bacteroidota bacterium]|nr:ROK family protein [Bacteroidota bacterium]
YEDLTGEQLPGVKEIAEEAKNNKRAGEIFKEFGTNLGEFLTPWFQKFDAQNLVLGGNLIKAWDLFGEPFVQTVRNSGVSVSIYRSELGETAAMVGCSRLFEDTYWLKVRHLLSKM